MKWTEFDQIHVQYLSTSSFATFACSGPVDVCIPLFSRQSIFQSKEEEKKPAADQFISG